MEQGQKLSKRKQNSQKISHANDVVLNTAQVTDRPTACNNSTVEKQTICLYKGEYEEIDYTQMQRINIQKGINPTTQRLQGIFM